MVIQKPEGDQSITPNMYSLLVMRAIVIYTINFIGLKTLVVNLHLPIMLSGQKIVTSGQMTIVGHILIMTLVIMAQK